MLTNGNSGKIQIPTVYENATVVPQSATIEQQGGILVFKVGENNMVSSSIITTKANINNLYVVESGLREGEQIVVNGVGKLRSNMPISPQEVAFDSVVKPIKTLFKN